MMIQIYCTITLLSPLKFCLLRISHSPQYAPHIKVWISVDVLQWNLLLTPKLQFKCQLAGQYVWGCFKYYQKTSINLHNFLSITGIYNNINRMTIITKWLSYRTHAVTMSMDNWAGLKRIVTFFIEGLNYKNWNLGFWLWNLKCL